MTIEKFEDIIAWQKAKELTLSAYKDFKLKNNLIVDFKDFMDFRLYRL